LQRGEKKAGPFLYAFQNIAVFLKGYLLFCLQKSLAEHLKLIKKKAKL